MTQARRDAEREAERNKQPIHYPTTEEFRAEAQAEAPSIEITITDLSGKVGQENDRPSGSRNPSSLMGPPRILCHGRRGRRRPWRTRWRRRLPPVDDEGGGFNAGGGHFVPAGKYKVAIAKRVDGKTTALASAQTFEVINDGAAPPIDFLEKVTRLQSAVSGALEAANTAKQRLATIKRALEDSPADPKLMEERNVLDRRLDALLLTLTGDQALRRRQENVPPSISQRANGVANETRGLLEPPTRSQQDQYAIAAAEFEQELPRLRVLIETDLKKFERNLTPRTFH